MITKVRALMRLSCFWIQVFGLPGVVRFHVRSPPHCLIIGFFFRLTLKISQRKNERFYMLVIKKRFHKQFERFRASLFASLKILCSNYPCMSHQHLALLKLCMVHCLMKGWSISLWQMSSQESQFGNPQLVHYDEHRPITSNSL